MLVYRFKVALFYDKRTYRQIDILGSQTLKKFHETIFNAFDRYDMHLYSFFLTRTPVKNINKIYDATEYCEPYDFDIDFSIRGRKKQDATKKQISSLRLSVKEKLYYLFDYGDSWWHEITLLSTYRTEKLSDFPKIVKRIGESPDQYPDYDEDEDW